MADTKFAPYAPPAAVLSIIRHYRQRDVPERLTVTNLLQIGVTESLLQRTMAALKFLDLLREDGTTTDQFRAIRYASEDDYQEVLGRMLDAAYKDVLDHIELSTATDREINNAFIPYSPGGQRERMITLFLALAREAGWQTASPAKPSVPRKRVDRQAKPKAPAARHVDSQDKPDLEPERERKQEPPRQPVTPGLLFGVTEADIAALPEAEFDAVWAALGKVAKARANALKDTQRLREAIAASRSPEELGE